LSLTCAELGLILYFEPINEASLSETVFVNLYRLWECHRRTTEGTVVMFNIICCSI